MLIYHFFPLSIGVLKHVYEQNYESKIIIQYDEVEQPLFGLSLN